MGLDVGPGENVLMIWSSCPEDVLLSCVERLRQAVGDRGDVQLENTERLLFGMLLVNYIRLRDYIISFVIRFQT